MIVHIVGEQQDQRAGHAQSTMLTRTLGAEWQEPLSMPPHECLVPILNHFHSTQPRLRDHVGADLRDAKLLASLRNEWLTKFKQKDLAIAAGLGVNKISLYIHNKLVFSK